MTKASEFREMSDEQLGLNLKDTTKNLFHLRLQAETERLDAPSELRKHRRMVARIKTVQRERELTAAEKAATAAQAAGQPLSEMGKNHA
jgi:large subunit ribosomal protein L29